MRKSRKVTNDRDLDCAAYLRVSLESLVREAIAAGWREDEVCNALLSLAQDRVSDSREGAVLDFGSELSGYRH